MRGTAPLMASLLNQQQRRDQGNAVGLLQFTRHVQPVLDGALKHEEQREGEAADQKRVVTTGDTDSHVTESSTRRTSSAPPCWRT